MRQWQSVSHKEILMWLIKLFSICSSYFQKSLNWIKLSLITNQYQQFVILEYQHNFGPKNYPRKSIAFTKILNYTKSSCIIFYAKMSQYYHYTNLLQKKLLYFGLKVSTSFSLEVWTQPEPKKSFIKNQKYSQRFFGLCQLLIQIFCANLCWYFCCKYYLHASQFTL